MQRIESIEDAVAFLSTCEREVLFDRAFGDEEVYWFTGVDGKRVEVASGYFGSISSEVGATETDEPSVLHWSFSGKDADKLRHCGSLVSSERNDNG